MEAMGHVVDFSLYLAVTDDQQLSDIGQDQAQSDRTDVYHA